MATVESVPDPESASRTASQTPPAPRQACPNCGSTKTQPFTHAGPGARMNMKCLSCKQLFRDPGLRR